MNKRKLGWILIIVSLFIVATTGVLVIIGGNSDYLIHDIRRRVALTILIIFALTLIYGIILQFKYKRRRLKVKKWKRVFWDIFISLYVVGCSVFVFVLYGPNHDFRDWLVTTAMQTMHHQHYCKWFYSEETIAEVMNNNKIVESGSETDESLIKVGDKKTTYKNEYEKEILEHDEDATYKLIRFEVNGQKAYLAAIYDPTKVHVGLSKTIGEIGQNPRYIAANNKAIIAINGGGFIDGDAGKLGAYPLGVTISKGKIISNTGVNGSVIGITKDGKLVLKKTNDANKMLSLGVTEAVTMGPFLIVNGEKSEIKGNGGWGYAARTAIGQREDGIILFLVVDSNYNRTKGASILDLANIMEQYGAINAANLDGGTSSVMIFPKAEVLKYIKESEIIDGDRNNYVYINHPIDSTGASKSRAMPTIFYVEG